MRNRRAIRPLFRRRSLTQLNFKDNQGKDHYSEFVVRTARMNTFTGELDGLYESVGGNETIVLANGTNTILIRPPMKQLWLLDHVSASHTGATKRVFSLGLVSITKTGGVLHAILPEGHFTLLAGGAANEQPIFPTWHDISGGQEQDHIANFGPQQLANNHYIQFRGFNMVAAQQMTVKYTYRRVK